MKIVNFRVSDAEHAMMHALAETEGLNLTAYIRRHFAMRFQELGLAEDPFDALRKVATPKPTPAPMPMPKPIVRAHMPLMDVDFDDGWNVEPPDA
jgi:hypothetical protein